MPINRSSPSSKNFWKKTLTVIYTYSQIRIHHCVHACLQRYSTSQSQPLSQQSNSCRSRKCIRWCIPMHVIFAGLNKKRGVEELFYLLVVSVWSPKSELRMAYIDRTHVKIGGMECDPACPSWIFNACTCFGLLA